MNDFRITRYTKILMIISILIVSLMTPGCTSAKQKQSNNSYDLIVVGSDPEGIAAAISGARNGLHTLLIDTRPEVGGLMTRGWLNTIDMNYVPVSKGAPKEVLNKGIFLEFFNQVEGDSFDVNTALQVFNEMLAQEENLEVILGAKEIKPVVKDKNDKVLVNKIKAVLDNGDKETYYCKRVIDATQDADIASTVGVPFSKGQEDMGYPNRNMAATLVFKLKGISNEEWNEIKIALHNDKNYNTGANDVSAWGFWDVMGKYKPRDPRIRVRGLNIGKQNDNSILINALQIFDVDPLSGKEKEEARKIALKELPYIVKYLKENIPGFQNVQFSEAAPELYIRESRHIYGQYRLTIDDVLGNKDFYDRIAFGAYPVDVQATGPGHKDYIVGNPKQYAIPFRSIVPQKIDNMLVVGRSASFNSLPHGSARVIPVGMATGQSAAVAAAIGIEKDVYFKEISSDKKLISYLRTKLNNQGMDIKPVTSKGTWNKEKNHWAYEGLKFVRKHGLARGGYSNNYHLDDPITVGDFIDKWLTLAKIYNINLPEYKPSEYQSQEHLTVKKLEEILYNSGYSGEIQLKGDITHGMAYMLMKGFFEGNKIKSKQ